MNSTTNVMALFLAALIVSFSLGMASSGNITISLNGSPIAAPDDSAGSGDDLFHIDGTQSDTRTELDTSEWSEYSNYVMKYKVRVPLGVDMLDGKQVISIFGLDQQSEDEDEIYDMRVWVGEGLVIELQYKKPTYESFEEEIAQSPNYYDLIKDNFDGSGPSSNLNMLHQGELRDTHLGQMLEQAYTYDTLSNGETIHVTVLYYDYYYDDDTEIIFYIEGYGDADIQQLRQIIEAMVSTFEHMPVNL